MRRLYQRALDELLRELPAAPEPVVMESPGGYYVATVSTEVSPPDDYLDQAVASGTEQLTS